MSSSSEDDLNKRLMAQNRPSRPKDLEEARSLIEGLIVPELARRGVSLPEARVMTSNLMVLYEDFASKKARREGFDQGYGQAQLDRMEG